MSCSDNTVEIKIEGENKSVECKSGTDLLSALRDGGVQINSPCGGAGLCGKCKVKLISGSVKGDVNEDGILCACKVNVVSDITVSVPKPGEFVGNEVNFSQDEKASVKRAAVALDIGTTTVSAALVDIESGKTIDSISVPNPQRVFGADVLSRITACKNGETEKLFTLINSCTEDILRRFIEKYALEKIERLVVAGNTVMTHLFIGEDASPLGEYPFTPVFLSSRFFSGGSVGLSVEEIYLLPSVSAFIGADVSAGIFETDLQNKDTAVLIDVGTNCEIALKANGKLYFCSAAAGPALEGAEISCGMGSVSGAVNKVWQERGKIRYSTIGGAPAAGICGAGLIDAVATLLRYGVLDSDGAFTDEETRANGFSLADGITLTAKDIRQFQLAKSAVVTGVLMLCEKAGIKPRDIKDVYLAGGLGFFMNGENAVYTGLLPKEFAGKTVACGNTSLNGCIGIIKGGQSSTCEISCEKIIFDLAGNPKFEEKFIDNTALHLI